MTATETVEQVEDELLTTDQLAKQLGVNRRTVAGWRNQTPPVGPAYVKLPGRLIRYRPADVREWLADLAATDNP